MAKPRPLQDGETRDIRPARASGLTKEQAAFAEVSVESYGRGPLLQLLFGDIYQEMPESLALDFGARIARAMKTRIAPGSRRNFRCAPGMSRQDRDFVEVILQNDFTRTWLRLEFADGNTVDFSAATGADFGDRIARAADLIRSYRPTPASSPIQAGTPA